MSSLIAHRSFICKFLEEDNELYYYYSPTVPFSIYNIKRVGVSNSSIYSKFFSVFFKKYPQINYIVSIPKKHASKINKCTSDLEFIYLLDIGYRKVGK